MDNLNVLESKFYKEVILEIEKMGLEKEIELLYKNEIEKMKILYMKEDENEDDMGNMVFIENNDFTHNILKSKFENWEGFKNRYIKCIEKNVEIREKMSKILEVGNFEEINSKLNELKIDKEVTLKFEIDKDGKWFGFVSKKNIVEFMRDQLKLEKENIEKEYVVYCLGKNGDEGFLSYGFSLK